MAAAVSPQQQVPCGADEENGALWAKNGEMLNENARLSSRNGAWSVGKVATRWARCRPPAEKDERGRREDMDKGSETADEAVRRRGEFYIIKCVAVAGCAKRGTSERTTMQK